MSDIDRLRQEVAETESAIDSAILLINGLSSHIREALVQPTPARDVILSELADELDAMSNRLAVAVAQNTVAEDDSDEPGLSIEGVEAVDEEQGEDPSLDEESMPGSEDTENLAESNSSESTGSAEPVVGDTLSDAQTGTTDPTESDSSGNNGQPAA